MEKDKKRWGNNTVNASESKGRNGDIRVVEKNIKNQKLQDQRGGKLDLAREPELSGYRISRYCT